MARADAELPPEFWQAVAEFNCGEYYACHDTLEALWMEASEPERSFYQGILQMAVALYHRGNGNLRGAMILLGEGIKRLRSYPQSTYGIDLGELLRQGQAYLIDLQHQTQVDASNPTAATESCLPLKIQRQTSTGT
jgi:uncharacterized protein